MPKKRIRSTHTVLLCLALFCLGCGVEVLFIGIPTGQTHKSPTTKPSTQPTAKPWWQSGVVYQLFLRSFQDSDGDGIGDLEGLIKRLDYLNDGNPKTNTDLGVDAIWLLPIFQSGSYHGYDTLDYYSVHPTYGKLATLKKLTQEAHKRGIRVILDLVINHSSDRHPWFLKSAASAKSPYRKWYNWRKDNPGWTQPWGSGSVWHKHSNGLYYYGIFWRGMPDLNLAHPPVKQEVYKIAKHWLNQGVDGFRLDAARYIIAEGAGKKQSDQPSTHTFWQNFRKEVKKTNPKASLIGEIWTSVPNITPYCQGNELDLAFHFPMAEAIYLAVTAMEAKPLWKIITSSKKWPVNCWAPFLANHDQERFISKLKGDQKMMRSAAILLMTMPGTPFIYYGEEIGMANGKSRDDKDKRTPMAWDTTKNGGFSTAKPWYPLTPHTKANVKAQDKDPKSLLSLYRKLIRVRKQNSALQQGKIISVSVSGYGSDAIFAMVRSDGKESCLILINLEDQPRNKISIQVPFGVTKTPTSLFQEGKVTYTWPKTGTQKAVKFTADFGGNGTIILKLQ